MMSPTPGESPPTVIFIHVTKTAGTTLSAVLEQQYVDQRICRTDHDFDRFERQLAEMPETTKRSIDCLTGHMAFGLHRYLPRPARYVTMLRNPIDRVMSYYYYALHAVDHPLHKQLTAAGMTLEQYVQSGILEELNDGQVPRLSGERDEAVRYGSVPPTRLESAKLNLREHFVAVGLTERFDASLLLFAKALGWKHLFYVPRNVTPNRPRRATLSPGVRGLIERYNRLDMELYEYAAGLFGQQLRRHGITPVRVAAFRMAARFRRARRALRKRVSREATMRRGEHG